MSELEPGLYVSETKLGWDIIYQPKGKKKGFTYESPPYNCADAILYALDVAKQTNEKVFVINPKKNTCTEVASPKDIPEWCFSFLV